MSCATIDRAASPRITWLVVVALILAAAPGAFAQTVTAAWDRNTDANTVGYRLYYGVSSGSYTNSVDAGNQISYELPLPPGQTYYFVVRAYNDGSQLGPPSNEASVTLGPSPSAPTAQISAARGEQPGTAFVTWHTANATSATINGAPVPPSGSATYSTSDTTTFTLVALGAGGSATMSATVTPPPVDCVVSAWSFQTATEWGECSGGRQTRTESWTRSVLTPPSNGGAACGPLEEERVGSQTCSDPTPAAPGAPTRVAARVSGSSVTVQWQEPATGGAPTGYRISAGSAPGASDIASAVDAGNALSVSGTLPRGTYYARVAAYNDVALGPTAEEIRFRVGAIARPGRPLGFAASLEGGVAVLSWQAPAGDDSDSPTGYVIEAGSAHGLADLARLSVGLSSTFQAPVPPGTYYLRVRAVNELGTSDASDEIVLRQDAGPGAPTDLAETGRGSMVALTWTPPTTGTVPTGYLVEAGSAPGRADLAALRLGEVTEFTTTAPPGLYYVRVRAVGPDGIAGAASNEVVVRR